MAVFSQSGGSNGGSYAKHFTGRLTVWEKGYDVAGNYSVVGRKLELVSGSSGRFSDYGASWSLNVDGQAKSGSGTYASMSYNTAQTIYEDEIIVYHNDDGSKKNMSCSATLDFASGTYSPGDFNLSGTMDLTTIPRASSITATDANIGSASTININRASDSFTHTVDYSFSGLTGRIATKTSQTSIGWSVPTSFFEKIPNAQSGTVTITCYTYSGNTHIGTKTTTMTVSVPTSGTYNSMPVIDNATAIDINEKTLGLTGDSSRLVTYFSNVKVNVTGRCLNYAGFSKLRERNVIDIPATTTTSNGTTNVTGEKIFEKNTSTEFRIVLVDTRQLASSYKCLNQANGDFKVVPYIPLTMSVNAERVSPTSASIKLNFSGNFYNGYYDEAKRNFNDLTIKWRYKLRDSNGWILEGADDTENGWHNLILGTDYKYNENANTYSSIDDITIEDLFDYQQNYTIEILYEDRLSSYKTQQPILVGIPNHDYGVDAEGNNYFNVNGNIYANGKNLTEKTFISETFFPQKDLAISNWEYANYSDFSISLKKGKYLVIMSTALTCSNTGTITLRPVINNAEIASSIRSTIPLTAGLTTSTQVSHILTVDTDATYNFNGQLWCNVVTYLAQFRIEILQVE